MLLCKNWRKILCNYITECFSAERYSIRHSVLKCSIIILEIKKLKCLLRVGKIIKYEKIFSSTHPHLRFSFCLFSSTEMQSYLLGKAFIKLFLTSGFVETRYIPCIRWGGVLLLHFRHRALKCCKAFTAG